MVLGTCEPGVGKSDLKLSPRGLGVFALETGHIEGALGNQNAVEDFTHAKRMTAAAGLRAKAARSPLETLDSIAYMIKLRGNLAPVPSLPLFW